MFLAKIVGKIVSVTKNEGLHGKKILIAVPINMNDEVSLVITSCGRFDLLEETLDSFFKYNT